MTYKTTLGVSEAGLIAAFVSGAAIGVGYTFLQDDNVPMNIVKKKALGGGTFVLGFYLFSPAFLRRLWLGRFEPQK